MKLRNIFLALVVMVIGLAVMMPRSAYADVTSTSNQEVCSKITEPDLQAAAGCGNTETVKTPVKKIINAILYIAGVLAVVMIIVGGIQMTTSAGNAGAVAKAKSTILWAVVGLIVAVLAYAIVNFVIGRVS